MRSLGKFSGFILKHHLEEYVTENLKRLKTMDIPIMKYFAHLSPEQLRELNTAGSIKFLTSLKAGTALEEAAESLRRWETDTMPGIRKNQIHPSDLVLIYSLQKLTLSDFLILYTQKPEEIVKIIQELEDYYSIVQNNAVQFLFKLQKEAEQNLTEKNARLEEAQAIAHIGSWEWDVKNKKVFWSREMYRIFGEEPKNEPLAEPLEELFFKQLNNTSGNTIIELLNSGKYFQHESLLSLKSGRILVIMHRGQGFKNNAGKVIKVLGTTQDITKIKLAEIEKQLSKQKDEFMGIASHELKTPLTSIQAYIELAGQKLENTPELLGKAPEIEKYIQKAKDGLYKLKDLIADLLDASKIQAGKMKLNLKKFNFEELLNECVESIGHISPQHKIIKKGSADIELTADRQRLEQVLMNYLTNAAKYSPEADKIIIKISVNKSNLTVGVTDFGIGIPPENREKIFERFFRTIDTSHRFAGLGLGLYISFEIIKRHSGEVWVESEEGKGSTFYFRLPLI